MYSLIVDLCAIFAAGTLVGVEFAVGFFVHPELWKLNDSVHATAAKSFAKVFGTRMPFWYAFTLVTTLLFAADLHQRSSGGEKFAWLSSGIWFFSILFTLIFPVPINNRIARFSLDDLPRDWKVLRRKWDRYHFIRNIVISAAFICLIIASLSASF